MFQDLGDIDPDLLQGFQRLLEYDGGDDEDIFGLDFRVGLLTTVPSPFVFVALPPLTRDWSDLNGPSQVFVSVSPQLLAVMPTDAFF